METIELIALVLVIFFVVSVNIGLIRAARGKIAFPEIELFRRIAHRARDPWKSQEEDLRELSRLVGKLRDRQEPSIKGDQENGPESKENN